MSETKTKEQQALEAAEEYVVGSNTDLTRHALLRGWFGDMADAYLEERAREDEDFSKMEFSEDGHLVCGIQSSRVIEHEASPDDVWHVGITLYSGSLVMDEEFWIVYEAKNPLDGSMVWVVEAE